MKKISKILILIPLILCASIPIHQKGFAQSEENKFTIWIKIHRIKMIDPIENPPQPEYVDWHYYITIDYGGLSLCENRSFEKCFKDKYLDSVHQFEVNSKIVRFYIDLVDEDIYTRRDLADISAHVGGGIDDYENFTRGTRFSAIYDAVNNRLLDADNFTQSSGYYITSGEYDGSSGVDENDVEMWFSVWDNYEPPKADAGPDRYCYLCRKITFDGTNSSASDASQIIRYEWDSNGDGEYELLGSRINYVFFAKGQYNISLRVTDSLGEIDMDTCIIYVDDSPPLVSFTFFPKIPTILDMIQFNDTSIDMDGYLKSRFWDFGDGNNSTEKNPTHRYIEKGPHLVNLIVEDNTGMYNSTYEVLNVQNIPPIADFMYSPKEPSVGEEVSFRDIIKDPDGNMLQYEWDFGEGHTSTSSNPVHSYESEGKYIVSLTVIDEEGETDTVSKIINLIQRHDLTLIVRDFLGFAISNAKVEIFSDDTGLLFEATNEKGTLTVSEMPQGLYEVKVTVLGVTTSAFCPLTNSITERITVPLSFYTLGLTIGIVVSVSTTVFYILKVRK